MDNSTQTEAPVGSDGATSSPDNASSGTQPTETTQPVSDGAVETGGQVSQPWDSDPKFKGKSPEDVYKAYKEAEKLTGQLSQKAHIANLIEQKYGVSPETLQEQIEAQEQAEREALYRANPLAPVLDEVNQLKAIVQKQEGEKALAQTKAELDSFLKDNPAYEAHKDKIFKLATTPGIGFDPNTGEEVSFEDIAKEYFGAARAQGQQDAYRKIETKEMTQATGVSRQAPKGKLTLDDLRKMTVAEQEAVLPHAGQ